MGLHRTLLSILALGSGLALAGCETFDLENIWSSKKPLPGERRAVFPEGVPGVQQGVPPNLVRGYQPTEAQPEPVAEPEKPKPAPRRVATPARPASTPRPQRQQQQQQQQQAAEEPQQPATQQPGQTAAPRPASQPGPAWPEPPARTAPQSSQPTTVWPDPPRPGTSTR